MANTVKLPTPDILSESGDLKDPYRGFIAKSKYNRWDEVKGRRETWVETVNRYVDWMVEHQNKRGYSIDKETVRAIRHAITYHHVMPSMRALMTAGPALEKNHIAAYNCSAIAVESIRAFDEALIVLMHGTGLGFSVENKYVDKLPEVAESFHGTTTVIRVEDSKEGWAKAFKEWLALLWSGQIPTYDVSLVRPKGERLRTFGGRASGPQPLVDLFEFTKDLLIKAAGRKITNLEAHDIMCKVAEIVVVGGVRRCLVGDSRVRTPKGWTPIADLAVGDTIVRGGESAVVSAKVNSGIQDTLKVSYPGGSLTMTPNHRMAVFVSPTEYVFKEASELEAGDKLVWDLAGSEGEEKGQLSKEYSFAPVTITSITPAGAHEVWDIEVEGIHEFTVNGVVSHNSALISLSDLGSQDMAGAKSGAWWVNNPQRALANNSAIYTKTPNMDTFFREWKNIYDSKSGERGIVNLDAVKKHMDSLGRRDSSKATLTNPCLAGDAYLMTADGWVTFKDAYDNGDPNDIVVDGRVQYTPSEDQKEHPDNWSLVKGEKYRPLTLPASEVFLTQKDAELVKVSLSNGMSVRLTPDHLVMTKSGMIPAGDLQPSDKVLITRGHLPHLPADPTPQHPRDRDAALMGLIAGDGTFSKGKTTEAVHIDLWGEDRWLAPKILEWINDLFKRHGNTEIRSGGNRPFTPYTVSEIPNSNKIRIGSSFLAAYLKKEYGFSRETKHVVPKALLNNASHSEARYYVAGLAFADGTVNKNSKVGSSNIRIGQSKLGLLQDVQRILLSNGISSSIYSRQPAGYSLLPDGHGGSKEYQTKEFFELVIMSQAYEYSKYVGFLGGHKDKSASEHLTPSRKQNTYSSVVSVVPDGREDVYCLREDSRRILSANGITMRRCGEINLRDKEFCNLTEVVASAEDTKETLLEKIRLATILGTWQASLTDFKYLRRKWTENVREEALLGVSITGIYGNAFLNGSQGLEDLSSFLDHAREYSVEVNQKEASRIGINPAASVTCVKPSGSASQLTGTSSGIHPWHAHNYIRRVRGSNHDPLVQLLKDAGVSNEPEILKPQDTTVFSFPISAPEGAIVQEDITALQHLELWRTYRNHWTEHNPSVTITVREHEWLEVGAYVFKYFDQMSGVSFLPDAGNHTYQQAPFEAITPEEYKSMMENRAIIPWEDLSLYELEDTTTGNKELACTAGACEVVDLEPIEETEKITVPLLEMDK